ncbi:MAG: exonuclease SbcCD subunit D [Oscillospiraceae bacterium]
MKILHTSDLHIGRFLHEYDLIEMQKYIFQNLYDVLKENKVDVLVIAGDVYNRSIPSSDAVSLLNSNLNRIIMELGVKIFMIYGNHDSGKRLSFGKNLFAGSGLYISGEFSGDIEKITLDDEYGKISFFLIPYFVPAEARRFLRDSGDGNEVRTFNDAFEKTLEKNLYKINPAERNIAVAHGFFANLASKDGEKEIITSESETSVGGSDIIDANCLRVFDYACLGHIHAPQRVIGENIRYSGSPIKYSISEENQKKAFTLIDIKEKNNINITQIPIEPLIDVCTIKGEFEQLLNHPDEEIRNNYVFVHLEERDVVVSALQRLKAVYPNILGLDYTLAGEEILNIKSNTNSIKTKTPEELFADFYEENFKEEMTEKQINILKSTMEKIRGRENETC